MHGFQWMLNHCSSILDFTLVDFHISIRSNQRPSVGNVAGRHVSMADMLTDNSVDLIHKKRLSDITGSHSQTSTSFVIKRATLR